MSDEPLAREREPIERVRARLEALVRANAARRCGARSKRTGKPCRAAAMPNGRCKLHGGKSTGPRTPEGLERSRRANWKHGHLSGAATAMPPANAHRLNAAQHLRQTGTHWCTWSAAKVCAAWRARGGKYICPPGNMSMGCRLQRGDVR
jgi:hypothetical protein